MRVVFAFSDAAAANTCLAQAFIWKREFNSEIIHFSNRRHNIPHWNFPIQYVDQVTQADLQQGDILFTGTSHPESSSSFEVRAILEARKKKIYTIAFVDHWTLIRKRFELDGENILPDEIWVLDETAKTTAINEGIPEKLVHIHKNPFHIYLSSYWKSAYTRKDFAKEIGLSSRNKIVVIAPDPISLRIKDFDPGFTEVSALNDLLSALHKLKILARVVVVIKAHPLQPVELLNPILDQYTSLGLTIKLLTQSDNPELINLADLVIGFYSNFLLEAHAMNKSVIRYFPGNLAVDPLKHLSYLPPISNPSQALLSLQS